MLVRELNALKEVLKANMQDFLKQGGGFQPSVPPEFTEEMLDIFDAEMDRFIYQQSR